MSTPLTGNFLVTRVMSGWISKANGISEINLWNKAHWRLVPWRLAPLSFIPFKLASSKFTSHEVCVKMVCISKMSRLNINIAKTWIHQTSNFRNPLAKTAPFIPGPVNEQDKRFPLQKFVASSSAPVKSACWSLALEKKGLMRQELTEIHSTQSRFLPERREAALFRILDTW